MLLNDIGSVPNTKFKKINQYLETNYGFKLAEDIDGKNLALIVEQIQDEITQLKIQGGNAKESPEISKRLMILEGIQSLNEFAMLQSYHQPEFENVVKNLSDYVTDSVRLGDDLEDAIRQAMKEYRSSRYRFPDEIVEDRVRAGCVGQFQPSVPGTPSGIPAKTGVMEDDDTGAEDEGMKESDIEEATDRFVNTPMGDRQRTTSAAATIPNTKQAAHALKALNNPSLSLEPKYDMEEPVPMQRNPNTGKMQADPWAAQAAARKKGIVMKEQGNLVKHLRKLLETEVSQAEVMMAAKGFAEELQEMVEKIGRLQNEDLPPVVDQMRETYGMESAAAFQTQIYGAMQGVMDALYTAKGQVDDAVSNMAATGQVDAAVDMDADMAMDADMGMDPGLDAGGEMDLDNLGDELAAEPGDEFGAADSEEPLGREKKMESAAQLKKRIAEMKRIVEKAKRLKEATR